MNNRFPFDTMNPIGFLVAVFIQYIAMINCMVAVKCTTIFFYGTCSMLFPLADDIKCTLKTINHIAKRKKKRSEVADQFSKFVQFHTKSLQLSQFMNKVLTYSKLFVIDGIK